jgi:peptidoglycan/LPS O-acetylase OafA/YrhL
MSRGLSLYLDLLRLLAAIQVTVYHLSWTRIGGLDRNILTQWGQEAVIVFFVLSGFVIRHAATHSDHTFTDFATSRISRLYSVILPCLAVTIICDLAGRSIAPEVYTDVIAIDSIGNVFTRLLISLAMLNQIIGSISFFSNVPYWSLCHEFWYYFLFAALFYTSGLKRVVLTAAVAVLAGRNVLILLPIWLIGVAAYSECSSRKWTKTVTNIAFLQPVAFIAAYWYFDFPQLMLDFIGPEWEKKLVFSKRVLSDTLLALSFGLHLAAAKQLDATLWQMLSRTQNIVGYLAGRSFTLYLMHAPVMLLLSAVSTTVFSGSAGWLIVLGTIGIPMLLGGIIEGQRYVLRSWLRGLCHYWRPVQPIATSHKAA